MKQKHTIAPRFCINDRIIFMKYNNFILFACPDFHRPGYYNKKSKP